MSAGSERKEKPTPPNLEFRHLSGRIGRAHFSCGEEEVDDYIYGAHKEHQQLKSRVVTAHLAGNSVPVGFYGLRISMEPDSDIDGHNGVFRTQRGHFAAVQICYLGVHHALQRRGIGELLMAHAVKEFGEVAIRTGICALTLVAINEQRAIWYERVGFKRYGKQPSPRPKLFFPARSATELLQQGK